jgi:hypothetical protein
MSLQRRSRVSPNESKGLPLQAAHDVPRQRCRVRKFANTNAALLNNVNPVDGSGTADVSVRDQSKFSIQTM